MIDVVAFDQQYQKLFLLDETYAAATSFEIIIVS